jgi:glycosyltransferase involved in cell wall biosynthesis
MTKSDMPYRVLILAEKCNPQWPSLPIVAYKYARALSEVAKVTLVTQVRNRPNIEAAGDFGAPVAYIDNEWVGRPLYLLAQRLRGGKEVAWSTSQIFSYLPYLEFERQALRRFRQPLREGEFDIVHRVTPMSPTLPSYIAGRSPQPFVIGPLNGNLDWPGAFRNEQKREREGLRRLRNLYRYLPYAKGTFTRASAILAAFQHTIDDLPSGVQKHTVPFPEIGFDEKVFHAEGRRPAFSGKGQFRFLFVGRLVPYKVPEAAIRAFAASERLSEHVLHIVGDGPERPRLEKMVTDVGARDRIRFEGNRTQAEVAEFMRSCDAFVFPSIRELGAGVVIEAMASGIACIVTDYGAPGHLAANERGLRVHLQPLEGLVHDYRAAMERCLDNPDELTEMAQRAHRYAMENFTWSAKAAHTLKIYESVADHAPLPTFPEYI